MNTSLLLYSHKSKESESLSTCITIVQNVVIRKFVIDEDKLHQQIQESKKKKVVMKKSNLQKRLENMAKKRGVDPYKHIAMETGAEFELFWKCSEEMAKQFPMKAELHQFMILTAMRKTEALRMKKEYIDFDKGKLSIPKEISKTGYQDEELPITPELEILLRNILDYENDPQFQDFYKMRDFPWLFATRRWKSERYFDKEFKQSHEAHMLLIY